MASPEMRRRSLEILSWCCAFHVFELPAHSFSVFVHLNAQTVSKSLSNLFFLLDSVWSSCKITFYGLLPSVFVWFSIPCLGCGWLVIYLPYCLPVLFWFNIFILDICCGVPWEIYLGCFFPKNSGDTELGLSMIAYLSTALKLLIVGRKTLAVAPAQNGHYLTLASSELVYLHDRKPVIFRS